MNPIEKVIATAIALWLAAMAMVVPFAMGLSYWAIGKAIIAIIRGLI